jgi:hypothetical protein
MCVASVWENGKAIELTHTQYVVVVVVVVNDDNDDDDA